MVHAMRLVVCLPLALAPAGCGGITPVREYVVDVTEEIGEAVASGANSVTSVLRNAWCRVFRCRGTVPDAGNPLEGTLHGEYHLVYVVQAANGREQKVRLVLKDPRMCRESVDEPFRPAPSNFPPALRDRLRR